jgi:hypothetical protein
MKIESEKMQIIAPIILSASRMTDMPKYYPDELIGEVQKRLDKGVLLHTLVLWTKHPASLFVNPLHDFLLRLKDQGVQLYIQLTVSGLGGVNVGFLKDGRPLELEPNAPKWQDALVMLPKVIDLAGNPDRIRLRIDPIVKITDEHLNVITNLSSFPLIIDEAVKAGIRYFSFSFLEKETHRKVDKRFDQSGLTITPPDVTERAEIAKWMKEIEVTRHVHIFACSVPGFPQSACIDGEFLENLHDKHLPTNRKQPFKRKLCGCTESIDIGGWPPKTCYTGCLYCYSRPGC